MPPGAGGTGTGKSPSSLTDDQLIVDGSTTLPDVPTTSIRFRSALHQRVVAIAGAGAD